MSFCDKRVESSPRALSASSFCRWNSFARFSKRSICCWCWWWWWSSFLELFPSSLDEDIFIVFISSINRAFSSDNVPMACFSIARSSSNLCCSRRIVAACCSPSLPLLFFFSFSNRKRALSCAMLLVLASPPPSLRSSSSSEDDESSERSSGIEARGSCECARRWYDASLYSNKRKTV